MSKQTRINLALNIVNEMVKRGFTFFSSVYLDAETQAAWESAADAESRSVDTMAFHIPGHAAVVVLQLRMIQQAFEEERYWLHAQVFIQSNGNEQAAYAIAKEHGWIRPHYDAVLGEYEVAHLPFFTSAGRRDTSPYYKLMPSWVYHGGLFATENCASAVTMMTNTVDTNSIAELASAVTLLLPTISTAQEGRITEMRASTFPPTSTFPDCADTFWDRFNTSYLRKLVRRTY